MKHCFENPAEITKTILITHYEIGNILLSPNVSAVVSVIFYDDDSRRHDRSFLLIDKDYTDWQTDDYLYSYVNSNFLKIFDN